MTDRIWLSSYPAGVPADIDAGQYPSLVALMEEAFSKYADRVAYSFMGKEITYAQTDSLSKAFAAYLQGLGLARRLERTVITSYGTDFAIASTFMLRKPARLGVEEHANVTAWIERLEARPSWQAAIAPWRALMEKAGIAVG